jgi:hypothetical protein
MKWQTLLLLLMLLAGSLPLQAQQDLLIGTWKLNVAKSNQADPPRSTVIKIEPVPNGVKFTLDAEDQEGNKAHQEYTAYFDGKFYPLKGDPLSDEVSHKRIDSRHSTQVRRLKGNIVAYRFMEVSTDGTIYTTRRVTADGLAINSDFRVFDCQ